MKKLTKFGIGDPRFDEQEKILNGGQMSIR